MEIYGYVCWSGPSNSFRLYSIKNTLLLISVATDTTHAGKDNLTRKIVETRCRYAVCTGHACELWHDYIDEAFVDSAPNFDPPNSRFVMTTWHEDEPVEDVVEFVRWKYCL